MILAVLQTNALAQAAEIALIKAMCERGVDLTNSTDGGDGASGRVASESHRQKMSVASKAISREARKRQGETMRQTLSDPEVRARWKPHLGHKHSAEAKAKMRAAKLGRTLSEEHRAKIGAAQADRQFSPEHRVHLRAAAAARQARGPWHSEDTKQKIRSTMLGLTG